MAGGKSWCRAEIEIIRQCSGNMRVKQICTLVGRTEAAVRTKARELGIRLYLRGKYHQSVKYPASDVMLARDLRREGLSLNEIAEKLEVPVGMIKQYVYFERRASA